MALLNFQYIGKSALMSVKYRPIIACTDLDFQQKEIPRVQIPGVPGTFPTHNEN